MILDEPTANLDPSGVQEVRDSILSAAEATGATLLVVEHRVSIWAPHMDRIIVLGEGGTITHDGAPDTVLTEARQELIDAGVWVPNYVPRAPQTGNIAGGENEGGEALLRAENLSITRAQPTPKQRRARRRTIKRLGDTPAPVPTDLPVLRSGINLTLHAGEHLSVLGPNGAGKSTLALTLAGLLTAPNGTLTATDALRNTTATTAATTTASAPTGTCPPGPPPKCSAASATSSKNPNTNSSVAPYAKNSNSAPADSPHSPATPSTKTTSPPAPTNSQPTYASPTYSTPTPSPSPAAKNDDSP